MKNKDPRLDDAHIYIREAIRMLEAAQMAHHLDHTDVTTVRAALEGLDIIQRALGGSYRPDDSRIVARLRQVSTSIKSCAESNVATAYVDIETASELLELMAVQGAAVP